MVNGTTIENNTGDGIRVTTTSGIAVAVIDNASIMDIGQNGFEGVNNVRADLIRSNVSIAGVNGILTSGTNAQINLALDATTVPANGRRSCLDRVPPIRLTSESNRG